MEVGTGREEGIRDRWDEGIGRGGNLLVMHFGVGVEFFVAVWPNISANIWAAYRYTNSLSSRLAEHNRFAYCEQNREERVLQMKELLLHPSCGILQRAGSMEVEAAIESKHDHCNNLSPCRHH